MKFPMVIDVTPLSTMSLVISCVAVGFIVESKTATHDENHRSGARKRLTFFALGCIKYTSTQA